MRLLTFIVCSIALAAQAKPDPHVAEVERGLLPPVVVRDVPPWTLEDRMRHYKVPGVSVAVFDGGRVTWAKGYGVADATSRAPVTEKTLFQAGSISKPVAAAGILRLADQKKIDLDRPIAELLKSWTVPENEFAHKTPITLARVLSHSAGFTVHGFGGYRVGVPRPTVPQLLDGAPPANSPAVRVDVEPGSIFRYSGGGYTVAQLAVTDVMGRPFADIMHDAVLAPLGLVDSTYAQPLPEGLVARAASGHDDAGKPIEGRWHVYPEQAAAGLWTTATDLARFAIGIERAAAGEKGAFLSPAMSARQLAKGKGGAGLGLFIDRFGPGTFGHNGANDGFQALFVASIKGNHGVAILTNSDHGLELAEEIARGAAAVYRWQDLATAPLDRASVSPQELGYCAGRYRLGTDSALTVEATTSGLTAHGLAESFELIPVAPSTFVRMDKKERYVFDGTTLVVQDGDDKHRATRMLESERTPSEILLSGDVAGARAAYQALAHAAPNEPAISDKRLAQVAAEFDETHPDAALVLITIATELHADSMLAWVARGDVEKTHGQIDAARQSYTHSLESIGRDTAPADFRNLIKGLVETRLKDLPAAPAK